MRLAEARIPAAAQQLIDRLRMAVGRVEVAQRIETQAERIDLAVRELLDMASRRAACGRCCPNSW